MSALMSIATGFFQGANQIRDDRAAKRQQYIDLGLARVMEIDKERRAELKEREAYRRKAAIAAAQPNAQGSVDDYAALYASGIDVLGLMQQGRDPIKRKPVKTPPTGAVTQQPMQGTTPMAQATEQPPQAPQMTLPASTTPSAQTSMDPIQALEAKGGTSGGIERALFGKRSTEGVGKELRGAAETAGINYDETMAPVEMPQLSEQAQLNIRQRPLLAIVAQDPKLLKHIPLDMLDQEDLTEVEALKLAGQAMTAAADEAEQKELSLYEKKKGIDYEFDKKLIEARGQGPDANDKLAQIKLEIVDKKRRGEPLTKAEEEVYKDLYKRGELNAFQALLAQAGGGMLGGGTDVGKQSEDTSANAPVSDGPEVGTIETNDNGEKFEFTGGDPADPNNWKKVN